MLNKIFLIVLLATISISSHSLEIEIRTVVVDGIGKDIESATQRSAESALIHFVGSFVDATKSFEKRKVIRDGVKSQTKKISSKVREYSQGVIQSIDVLDVVVRDDGLIQVTSKVSVRIEDFKNYIKETTLAGKKIKKGLFAKMKAKKEQTRNLSELIFDKLKDVFSSAVMVPVIDGEIEEVTNLYALDWMNKKFPGEGYVLKIPVKVTLNPAFLENFMTVLDETADKKFKGYVPSKINRPHIYSIVIADFEENPSMRRYLSVADFANKSIALLKEPRDVVVYLFPERSVRSLCEQTLLRTATQEFKHQFSQNIRMSFVSENGSILRDETLSYKGLYWGGQSSPQSSIHMNMFKGDGYGRTHTNASLVSMVVISDDGCGVFIDTESEFFILTKVSSEIAENISKVTLRYVQ